MYKPQLSYCDPVTLPNQELKMYFTMVFPVTVEHVVLDRTLGFETGLVKFHEDDEVGTLVYAERTYRGYRYWRPFTG